VIEFPCYGYTTASCMPRESTLREERKDRASEARCSVPRGALPQPHAHHARQQRRRAGRLAAAGRSARALRRAAFRSCAWRATWNHGSRFSMPTMMLLWTATMSTLRKAERIGVVGMLAVSIASASVHPAVVIVLRMPFGIMMATKRFLMPTMMLMIGGAAARPSARRAECSTCSGRGRPRLARRPRSCLPVVHAS
jgi:hypothetical protein